MFDPYNTFNKKTPDIDNDNDTNNSLYSNDIDNDNNSNDNDYDINHSNLKDKFSLLQDCLKAMEKDSQMGSSLSRQTLNKFKKKSFDEKETNEVNEILRKLGLPKMADFKL